MNERVTPPVAGEIPATPKLYGLRSPPDDRPQFFRELVTRWGDIVRWRFLFDLYVLNHPEDVKKVLSAPTERFTKGTLDYQILRLSLGQGLVTSDGPLWTHQRKLMQPMFHNRSINPFDEPINRLSAALAARWAQLPTDHTLFMEREMAKLTFEVVGTTLFGTDIEQHSNDIAEVLEAVNVSTQELRSFLLLRFPWLPLPHTRKFHRAIAKLDRIVFGMINARRASGNRQADILDRLLAARDEDTGQGMNEQQIRDEVVTLLLAGHETSSNALAWTFWFLTQHREVEAKLLAELDSVLQGRPATSADLAQLPYLKQVVQESMRLLPPVWAVARLSHEDEVFQGYRIPAGSNILIPIYAIHRHPAFWPDPDRFDPERFSPQRTEPRHSYSYIPFSAGPRTCIGASMAMLEVQLVIANLLPRFRMELAPGARIETAAKVTLTPKYGMPMRLSPRAAAQP